MHKEKEENKSKRRSLSEQDTQDLDIGVNWDKILW